MLKEVMPCTTLFAHHPMKWWRQQELAAHLGSAQPVEALDASDTEAKKGAQHQSRFGGYRVQIALRLWRLMSFVAS